MSNPETDWNSFIEQHIAHTVQTAYRHAQQSGKGKDVATYHEAKLIQSHLERCDGTNIDNLETEQNTSTDIVLYDDSQKSNGEPPSKDQYDHGANYFGE